MNSHVEQRRAFLIDFAFVAVILALIYVFFKFLFWITAPFLLSFFFAVILQKPLRYLDKKTNKKAHTFWSIFLVVVSIAVIIVPLSFIFAAIFGKISDFINYLVKQLSDISSFLSTVENWVLNTLQFCQRQCIVRCQQQLSNGSTNFNLMLPQEQLLRQGFFQTLI